MDENIAEREKVKTSVGSPENRALPAQAMRALAEAEERRKQRSDEAAATEIGGRGGKDPARYGDWEIKGRAIDF